MSRVEDLRNDYDRLGLLLSDETDGAKAAALARERRLVGELLESLETPRETSVVDELESRRRTVAGGSGATPGRRQSG